jgi:NCS1 family nucleobase:cation symporter-1
MIVVIVPMLPALANKVTPTKVQIPTALSHIFAINWLYGFIAACVLYYVLNLIFPDRGTLIPSVIHGDMEVVEGVSSSNESTDGDIGHAEKALNTEEPKEVGNNGYREAKTIA